MRVLTLALLLPLQGLSAQAAAPASDALEAAAPSADPWSLYELIRQALVQDKLDGARAAAEALARSAGAGTPGDTELAAVATQIAVATDLPTSRLGFSALSKLLITRLAATPSGPKLKVYFCPMWEGYGWWVQQRSGISNPYMGSSMPACGEERSLRAAAKAATSG